MIRRIVIEMTEDTKNSYVLDVQDKYPDLSEDQAWSVAIQKILGSHAKVTVEKVDKVVPAQ